MTCRWRLLGKHRQEASCAQQRGRYGTCCLAASQLHSSSGSWHRVCGRPTVNGTTWHAACNNPGMLPCIRPTAAAPAPIHSARRQVGPSQSCAATCDERCTFIAGDATSASNNKAEAVSQPPSELFRSGELSFGTFGDEAPAGEVSNRDSSCNADMHRTTARTALATISFQVHAHACMHSGNGKIDGSDYVHTQAQQSGSKQQQLGICQG